METGPDMSTKQWILAGIVAAALGLNVWAGWFAYRVHQAHRILDDIQRRLLDRGGAR
jgi:hypothetical protein